MARTLCDFINRHAGETAYVFGKGPSLAEYDLALAGPLRVAINDLVGVVPCPTYCFANDSVRAWAHLYQPGQVLFQPRRTVQNLAARNVVPTGVELVAFDDDNEVARLRGDREQLAREGLVIQPGTLGSVTQVLHVMGISRIVAVGIDGGGRHAPGFRWHTDLRNDHARDYNNIREAFISNCDTFGIGLEFFHGPQQPAHQTANGFMTIRILSNCFVKGIALAEGEVHDVLPSDARILVQMGRARYFTPPPGFVGNETASIAPVRETAVPGRTLAAPKRKLPARLK